MSRYNNRNNDYRNHNNHNNLNYKQKVINNNNKNNNGNNFNPNNSIRIVEKKEYQRNKSIIEHKKIMKIFNEKFNPKVKKLFSFDDILTMRINRDRIGVSIYFYRYFPDNFDYFSDPDEGIMRISKLLPIFSRLSIFITNQTYGVNMENIN